MQLQGYQSETTRSYGPMTVETKYGKIIFHDVLLWNRSSVTGGVLPWFSAHIENLTGTTWHVAEFTASFQCGVDTLYKVVVPTIVPGEQSFRETSPQVAGASPCNPSMVSIRMIGGRNDRDEEERRETERQALEQAREQAARQEAETEQKRTAAQRTAAQKARARRDADEKAAQNYLAKFPILNSGASSLFIGADRKCSEQFVQALSMGGLEGRKRLTELVTYGCGFIEDSGVHVMRIQAEGAYCQVQPINGKHPNEAGWVPCSWVK